MTILITLCVFLTALLALSVYITWRFAKRALQFDHLFDVILDDIWQNKEYFDKLLNTPMLANVPEIISLRDNMKVMHDRFCEYIITFDNLGVAKK